MNQGGVYRNSKHRVIKQHEIITILGGRVGAGKVPMSAIDVAWSVFSLGLFGVVHRQGENIGGCRKCDNE